MMIDRNAVIYVLNSMPDGFLFEQFSQKVLSLVKGDEFIPVGGKLDRGVDGFQGIFSGKKLSKLIFQMSTEEVHWKQERSKITTTADKLIDNNIEFDILYFVTNRKVERIESIISSFYEKYQKVLVIYDQEWFATQITLEPTIADIYNSFIEHHVHEYKKPGKFVEVGEFSNDPRLYVFLRQHLDKSDNLEIENNIIDGLILFALEGTGSDLGVFLTIDQIIAKIRSFFNFDLPDFEIKIQNRLDALSRKPYNLIKYHSKEKYYCLPYETRLELKQRDIEDASLQDIFETETTELIKTNLNIIGVEIKEVYSIFEEILHWIYYRLGLEFSDFILNESSKDTIDDSLGTVVAKVVDDSKKTVQNKDKINTALLISLREIVYNGSNNQREFLRRLSKTYLMVFLTQNDPKISTFFKTLANKLEVFVCTSIIIPALSEYFLQNENKRYWNLLIGANQSGVGLKINEFILDELVSHFDGLKNTYLSLYKSNEEDYLQDDYTMLYVDEILLRAYFYALKRGRIKDFNSFLYKFVDPTYTTLREDLIFFLKETFGIEYISSISQEVQVDVAEVNKLRDELKLKKRNSIKKAEVDSKLILHIYKLREKNNESNTSGIFGYKTWWLSQDINTFRAVKETFGDKYGVSCYLRADFMYKYISLSPHKTEIDKLFRDCFPSLLGVNLSYHIPQGISEYVGQKIIEHKDTDPSIVKRTLKNLTARLMSDMESLSAKEFKSYFDEELKKVSSIND